MESGEDYFQHDSAEDSMEFEKKLEESYQVSFELNEKQHLEKSSSKASNRVGTAKLRPSDRQRSSKSLRRDSSIVQGSGIQSLENPIPVVEISEPNTKEATAREQEQKDETPIGQELLLKFAKFVEKSQIKPGEFGKMNYIGLSEFRLCFKKIQYHLSEGELKALWEYVNPKGAIQIPMKQFVNSVSTWSRFHVKRAHSVQSATSLDISKPVNIVRNLSGTGNERKFPKNRTAYFLKQAKLREQEADRALKMALDKGRRQLEFDCLHKMGEACEIARQLNLPVSFSAFKGADGSLKIHFIRLESGAINEENQVQEKQLITIEEFLREYKRLKRNQSSVRAVMQAPSQRATMTKIQSGGQMMPATSGALVPFQQPTSSGKMSKKERQDQLKSVLEETMKLTNQLKEQLRILQRKGVCKLQKNFNSTHQASLI